MKSGLSQYLSERRKKRGDTLASSPASTKTPSLHSIEPGRVGKGTINFCQSFSQPILPKSFSQFVPPDTQAPRGSKDPPPGPRASADCQSWAQALEWMQNTCRTAQTFKDDNVKLLQNCLLQCSQLTRSINLALTKNEAEQDWASVTQKPNVGTTQQDADEEDQPKRKRLRGKQPVQVFESVDKGTRQGIPETYSWQCNLCDFSFSANNKGTWSSKKSLHISAVHPKEKHLIADRRTWYPLIEVANLPWNSRQWTCASCGLGLPWLPPSQLVRSRDAHLEQCQPGKTAKDNWHTLKQGTSKEHVAYKVATRRGGWHSEEWRKNRTLAAKAMGHDLQSFVPNEGLIKSQRLRYTCRFCKWIQKETDVFTRRQCTPHKMPKKHVWREIRLDYEPFIGNLLNIWGWGRKHVITMDSWTNAQKLRGLGEKN